MPVQVSGIPLNAVEELSPKAKLLMAFVRDGFAWLRAVLASPSPALSFADEADLLEAVQSGLHGNSPLLLPKLSLQVGVRRLWELEPEVLTQLREAETRTGKILVKTRRLLAEHHLWSQQELDGGRDFLSELGVEGKPVFQGMTLGDLVALFALAASDPEIEPAAADFALARAVTAKEFGDYYRFHLLAGEADGPDPTTVEALLRPVLLLGLAAPHAADDLTPGEAGLLARTWLDATASNGLPGLGFPTLSEGLAQVVALADEPILDERSALAATRRYGRRLRDLLGSRDPDRVLSTQDGTTQLFFVSDEETRAVLARHRLRGTLTVSRLWAVGKQD